MNTITYNGRDNLDVMELAVHYNESIFYDILRYMLQDIDKRGPRKNYTILDFGAGKGGFAKRFQEMGFTVLCVEADPILIEELKEKGLTVKPSIDEIPRGTVDMLYAINVLEHIADDRSMLEAWRQVLKPHGKLYVYVPAFSLLFSSMDRKVGHHRRYCRESLVKLMKSSGYTITDTRYVDSLGFITSLAYRVIGPDSGDINPQTIAFYDQYIFPVSLWLDNFTKHLFGKNLVVCAKV